MTERIKIFSLVALTITMAVVYSCKKDEPPANPYETIDRSTSNVQTAIPDPNSIVGLHKNIFFPKCANPGCHDGTFEPDFRTVQSSFATLVYQQVKKVTLQDSLKFYSLRVIPHNTSDSWLIERLTTSSAEYMPSNAVRLSTAEIDHVKNWINAGCPDNNGILPVKPNLQPNIVYYAGINKSSYQRVDSIRLNNLPYYPFVIDPSVIDTMRIAFFATDTADGADATDPSLFTVKKIRFSTDKNDFSGPSVLTINASFYISQANAWIVIVPMTLWPIGTTVYFRVYVNDGHHTNDSEFPKNETIDYYKTYYAFYVQ